MSRRKWHDRMECWFIAAALAVGLVLLLLWLVGIRAFVELLT